MSEPGCDLCGPVTCPQAVFSGWERGRRAGGAGDRRSQELTALLQNTLESAVQTELYPRSQIDVYVQVLQVRYWGSRATVKMLGSDCQIIARRC